MISGLASSVGADIGCLALRWVEKVFCSPGRDADGFFAHLVLPLKSVIACIAYASCVTAVEPVFQFDLVLLLGLSDGSLEVWKSTGISEGGLTLNLSLLSVRMYIFLPTSFHLQTERSLNIKSVCIKVCSLK